MDAVREALCVSNNRLNGQSQFGSYVTACQKNSSATLRLNEAPASAVIGTGVETLLNALLLHLLRVGCRVHGPETNQGFHRQVVSCPSNNELRLARSNLVDTFLNTDRSCSAGRNRLDHCAVAANVALHRVCCDNVWKGFLQDVLRELLT